MFRNIILEIFEDIWVTQLIFLVLIAILRIIYLILKKQKFVFYKEVLYLIFVFYIMSLFRVVTFQDVDWSSSNFILFKEIFRYDIGSKLFLKNVIGNVIIFIPFGFFISYFLKIRKIKYSFLLTLLGSSAIEFMQLIIGRVFDIDDILLNVIGGLIGYFIFKILKVISIEYIKIERS